MKRIIALSFFLLVCLCGAAPYQEVTQVNACETAYGRAPSSTPTWLSTDLENADLATQNRYDLLAGQLLKHNVVDGSSCPSNGLNPDGSPNACGLQVSQDLVTIWQNQYDRPLKEEAHRLSLPPLVLKAVIAVESQFWPGADWNRGEIGLGQMTEFGADLVLAWRPAVYQNVCRQVYSENGCSLAYLFQDVQTQRLLRGRLLSNLDATCPSCTGGVDPKKGEAAVSVLAEALSASCAQSARTITVATGHTPASLMSYEDFWRFALANYHSGSGCMYEALRRTGNPSNWPGISSGFPRGCLSGSAYVRRVEEQVKP
jgi:hypothetical protein